MPWTAPDRSWNQGTFSKDARCAAGFDAFSVQVQCLRLRGGAGGGEG